MQNQSNSKPNKSNRSSKKPSRKSTIPREDSEGGISVGNGTVRVGRNISIENGIVKVGDMSVGNGMVKIGDLSVGNGALNIIGTGINKKYTITTKDIDESSSSDDESDSSDNDESNNSGDMGDSFISSRSLVINRIQGGDYITINGEKIAIPEEDRNGNFSVVNGIVKINGKVIYPKKKETVDSTRNEGKKKQNKKNDKGCSIL